MRNLRVFSSEAGVELGRGQDVQRNCLIFMVVSYCLIEHAGYDSNINHTISGYSSLKLNAFDLQLEQRPM